ncbi:MULTISPECIES: WYL domain-containing protein [unclassified Bradyrhizobium]|uniref:WYL domain-containing protein n=1 Tax=unclassified Bradyrhizobium TaxID=2631580 RepID=UPI0029162829|nr:MULTISPECIES: WYL domain-containing protein [unclassified Bradyrhizobium]
MSETIPALKWGIEQRLEFIEFRLFWDGRVNRSDIIEVFGVSVPQASKDLAQYQELAPRNLEYDKSAKRYVCTPHFQPRFLKPDPDAYLARLRSVSEGQIKPSESWIASPPDSDVALTPKRDINMDVLRTMLAAVRDQRSLEIFYQSMNRERPDPMWRRITPHAFGYDGLRWHARAYCHLQHAFDDFLLPRALKCRGLGAPGLLAGDDHLWREHFSFEIIPHPKLTPSQQAVVAKDYGMKGGKRTLSVRYAMLFYVLKRLGLLNEAREQDPRQQHIVLLEPADVQSALRRVESSTSMAEKTGRI